MTARVRFPLVVFTVLVLQHTAFDVLLAGVRPDVLLLVAVAAGAVAGSERGAVLAFAVGLVADLFTQTPFGLSALTFALVAFAVGTVQGGLIRAAWWMSPLTAVVGSVAGVLLFAVAGSVIGRAGFVRPELAQVALWVAVVNAVLAVPVVRVVQWSLPSVGLDGTFAR